MDNLLEKTIQGLEICIENIDKVECPEECPYYEKCMAYDRRCVFQPLLRDTLATLKAQQERIKELKELLHEGGCDGINACDVKACPYYNASHVQLEETKDEKIRELQKEIHKLKAAQEPRVMSLDEIMEIYNTRKTHIWPHDTAPYIFVEEHPDIHTYHGSWTVWREIMAILSDGIFIHTRNTYGKTWRCWSTRPTDEQREAVKWE